MHGVPASLRAPSPTPRPIPIPSWVKYLNIPNTPSAQFPGLPSLIGKPAVYVDWREAKAAADAAIHAGVEIAVDADVDVVMDVDSDSDVSPDVMLTSREVAIDSSDEQCTPDSSRRVVDPAAAYPTPSPTASPSSSVEWSF